MQNRWVFKIKTHPDGTLQRYKAHLVVKGYRQIEGIDYDETFAPVSRYETVRIMLSIAAARNWHIKQFDIGTAFLNSPIDKLTFMEQPEGYGVGNNLVCELDRGMYGLKQAPRAWHKTLYQKLTQMDFTPLESDSCVYRKNNSKEPIYIVIYVDDGLMIGPQIQEIDKELAKLKADFELKIQPLNRFLGIEIARNSNGIFIHQRKYIEDILGKFNMLECKISDIPMQPGLQLEGESPPEEVHCYSWLDVLGQI